MAAYFLLESPSSGNRKYLGNEILKNHKSSGKGLICKGCKKSVIPDVCCIAHDKGEGTPTGTPEHVFINCEC